MVRLSAAKDVVVYVDTRAPDRLCLCLIMVRFGGKVAAVSMVENNVPQTCHRTAEMTG